MHNIKFNKCERKNFFKSRFNNVQSLLTMMHSEDESDSASDTQIEVSDEPILPASLSSSIQGGDGKHAPTRVKGAVKKSASTVPTPKTPVSKKTTRTAPPNAPKKPSKPQPPAVQPEILEIPEQEIDVAAMTEVTHTVTTPKRKTASLKFSAEEEPPVKQVLSTTGSTKKSRGSAASAKPSEPKKSGAKAKPGSLNSSKTKLHKEISDLIDGDIFTDYCEIVNEITETPKKENGPRNLLIKDITTEHIYAFLTSDFITTINAVTIKKNYMPEGGYDEQYLYCHYHDANYDKRPEIKPDVPKYVKLMLKLNRATYKECFLARSNWIISMDEKTKIEDWNESVASLAEYKADTDSVQACMEIFAKLLSSKYVQDVFMFMAKPHVLFEKVFYKFLDCPEYKDALKTLFEGPLRKIAHLFMPIDYRYRDITYDTENGFALLMRQRDDAGFYNPEHLQWLDDRD